MRLIDADANIETMKKCAENPENKQALLCYRYTQRILEEAPTVEPSPPWHRVEEELPEKFVNVILANKRGKHYDIDKGWWNGYSFDRCAKGIYRNVTHWMPLPEPPKEGV